MFSCFSTMEQKQKSKLYLLTKGAPFFRRRGGPRVQSHPGTLDQSATGRSSSSCFRCMLFDASSNGRVSNAVVDPSKVDDHDWEDPECVWWAADHRPDAAEYEGPPLEDEDNDEDHHPGGVAVSSGVHIDQLGRSTDLDEDGAVGDRYRREEGDLEDADALGVHQTSLGANVGVAPATIDGQITTENQLISRVWRIFSSGPKQTI